MNYASSAFKEKPLIDQEVGMQVYLHEGGVWVQGHFHEENEIVYAISGVVSLEVNHEIIHLNVGESLLIRPGEVHSFIASPKSIRLVIQFTKDTLSKSLHQKYNQFEIEAHLDTLNLQSRYWDESQQESFHQALFKIQETFNDIDKFREVKLLNFTSNLMMVLYDPDLPKSKYKPKESSNARLSKLQDIYDYIEKYYQEDIRLEDIANHVSYNKQYLTRYFKSMTGMSVFTFINDYRLNQAKWLLISTEKAMDEIAYEAGFQSTKRFHHLFKEVMDISPLQYRKKNKERKQL